MTGANFLQESYDVVICGGGLAGQTLARQLRRAVPDQSILLVDRLNRPLPESAFKVGESSVELGAHYLSEKLGLSDYFNTRHLFKCGLRYFLGDTNGPFHERPEYGLSGFPKVHSYQIDRGMLENDLRAMNQADGVHLLEGADVSDVALGSNGQHHVVEIVDKSTSQSRKIEAKWVVDASGRRRLLQKKLGLDRKKVKGRCSSSWFRYEGRIDISDMVPAGETAWHARVPERNRYFSTNHIINKGYWVWFIPLGSGNTSVGIVALDEIHPFSEYNTYPRSLEWLRHHEPVVYDFVKDLPPMDFKCLNGYSYTSKQVYSIDRWACVGEAGVFSDPFYSPGNDMIGFGNSMVTSMIKQDAEGTLTPKLVDEYNWFLIGLNDSLTDKIQQIYPLFGHPPATAAKLVWDNAAAWGILCPQMFNSTFLDPFGKHAQLRAVTARFFALTNRMHKMFSDWAQRAPGNLTFGFFNYLSLDFLHKYRARNLRSGKEMPELLADARQNMAIIEELAQALFLIAVEDVMPEQLHRFPKDTWLNAWHVGLDPERWDSDGLFAPESAPRDFGPIREQIRALLRNRSEASHADLRQTEHALASM
jgi:flavin-dependent dehydrogenase